jgi:hypothetical protein
LLSPVRTCRRTTNQKTEHHHEHNAPRKTGNNTLPPLRPPMCVPLGKQFPNLHISLSRRQCTRRSRYRQRRAGAPNPDVRFHDTSIHHGGHSILDRRRSHGSIGDVL